MVGKSLAHYQILERLGAGGMGVVYKARDTHLDRFVAVKVLPPEKVSDPDRKRRFVQEAKAASALNHPNIVHVYDIDQSEGTDFIAMECVEGKTLDELMPRKGMRPKEALTYAVQIADALAAAHVAGIVHRDLKPANIMVTEKGLVKVFDFGLAKLTEQVRGDETATTATIEDEGRPVTQEGIIVGTVAYMSPEQAEGKKVDARSDIFSFGSVLYEMVTGQKAFQGTSKMSTLSAILHQEAKPVSSITPTTPADLEKLINRCLKKDPARRWQTMADVKVALDELKEDSDSGRLAADAPALRAGHPNLWLAMILVAGAVLSIAGWLWLGRSRPAAEEETLTPIPLTTYPGTEANPSFSPDGTQVAFQWCPEGGDWAAEKNCDIYVKQIGVEPPSRLTDTPEEEYSPAWSPDGRLIAFLRRLPGKKIALLLIPQRGGRERILAELDASKGFRLDGPYTAWTPDSKWVATPAPDETGAWVLYLFSIETGERRRLTNSPYGPDGGDTAPAFSPNGRNLLFARGDDLRYERYILPLGEGYAPQGEPVRVPSETRYGAGAAWMPDGSGIVFSSWDGLWRAAASSLGQSRRLPFATGNVSSPAVSRQGNRLAYAVGRGDSNIWRLDLHGPQREPGTPVKIIASTHGDDMPTLSPDRKRIAFRSDRSGWVETWQCDSDGSNPTQIAIDRPRGRESPDGQRYVFEKNVEGNNDIYVISANGGTPRRLTTDTARGSSPCWSHDGKWIYFKSARGGTVQIWRMPAGGGDAVQISHDPGADLPHESTDGRFLFYSKGWPNPQSVWRVAVEGGEATKVLDGVHPTALWTVAENGIYFFTKPDEKGHSDLSVYEFATGKTRKILTIERPVTWIIDVSTDGRTILYTQVDESGSDLMLVENFR